MSHFFTYHLMGSHQFYESLNPNYEEIDQYQAMDEAFAEYWLSIGIDSTTHTYGSPIDIQSYSINNIHQLYAPPLSVLDESFYSWYDNRYPIASVWWTLRENHVFGEPDPFTDTKAFDSILVRLLKRAIAIDDSLRYKPRYFYNRLMKYFNDNSPLTHNILQNEIDKAYSDKGLFFTPKVISAGIANPTEDKDKNMFRVGDPIYMKAINCPQNTPVTIYIVEDQEYTDGMSISTLNPLCEVNGTSNSDGVWSSSTPLMTALTPGDYDILVDIGNNGVLHFAYEEANVRDGFDGLDEPGFTIYDDGIDVVLALDLSQSMIEECSNLQQLTRRFISAMLPGDKINVFGFNEGTPPNWSGGYTNLSPTPASQLYTITPSNQNSLINSVGCPSAEGNTDLLVPFTYGYHRFDASSTRKKAFVLLSDGEHYPTIDLLNPNNPNVSNPHRMSHVSNGINSNYNTRDIRCFTMRFGDISTGTINMNNIASWGHGIAYRVPILSSMPLLVSRLMNNIRGNPPSYDNNHSIPPNSNQTLPIVVDDMAGNLRTTLIWNTSGTTSVNEFTLTSPSGITYSQPEGIGTSTYKYDIDTPESGVWTASITNHYASALTYSMISELDSDLTVCIDDIPTSNSVDCPMLLNVSVSDYTTPISNALVTAVLKKGDWELSVDLYDDGCHNDGSSEDGMYGNYLYAYADIVNTFPYYQQYGDFDLSIIVDIPSRYGKRIVNQSLYLSPANQNSYPQTVRNLHDGWNWVGYPRLQRDDVGSSIPYANASLSPVLTDIVSSDGIAEYRDDKWSYYGLQSLKSDYGYKLRIKDTDSVRLFELGSIIDTLHTHNLKAGQWNWVTYPCYETVYPWEALSGVIDNIDYIMAESWSMKKDGDVWIHDGYARPRLMYGDSIMIWAVDDCTFVWNSPLTTPIVINPRKPSNFVFEDKPDYETIMIESIEGNPEFQEIGVFQDNVCIGARVNEAYPIQILAYSTPEEDGGGQLSFMLYSESKGVRTASPITIDHSSITTEESTITPIRYGFRLINLKTNDNETPPDFTLHSNYPNPFNPSTTIRFSIPKTAPVRLVIYNIRGQKVKDLLNETLAYGNHSIVWNGRDDKNRLVASGVYFARLEQNGVTKVSKMMMLK